MNDRSDLIGAGLVASALMFGTAAQGAPQPVRAPRGMVASSSDIASRVGVEIMQRGGNAVDAAVAVGFALAVTHPVAGNLGGGGFMLVRMSDGKTAVIDYRETAPAAATSDMYLSQSGDVVSDASTVGYRAVAVPGTVAGLALAHRLHGSMSWAELVEPARRIAADGFIVSHGLAESLRAEAVLARFAETRRIFLDHGRYRRAGDLWRQPELAATLERIKRDGPREFYEGQTARLLADDMAANGGLITMDDLRTYEPTLRVPLRGTYRGHEIITIPPPSSGGVALIEMLNMLEPSNLAEMGFNSSATWHCQVEVMRRAFADRAEFMGDPAFVTIPTAGLMSRAYAAARCEDIDSSRATPSATIRHGDPPADDGTETTHFSIVDRMGNAVANTYTLNTSYGSGVTVPGAGFLLNNEMDDFTSKPGVPNAYGLIQSSRNAIAPRRRPLSSMTPTIVLKDGKLFLVVGTPGGPTIINTVLHVLVNVIDHGMNIRQAIEAPRFHHQWLPDEIRWDPYGISADTRQALERMGHRFEKRPRFFGDAQGIMIDVATADRLGASDPRGATGAAVGF